jgi:hypothetical protein
MFDNLGWSGVAALGGTVQAAAKLILEIKTKDSMCLTVFKIFRILRKFNKQLFLDSQFLL